MLSESSVMLSEAKHLATNEIRTRCFASLSMTRRVGMTSSGPHDEYAQHDV